MFSSVGWGELLILLIAGLVILGPERLPGAVTWSMKSLRQVREYATGATSQLKDDLGPEFEDFRAPLAELNQLRGMTPRSIITKHLLDGDESFFTGNFDDTTKIKPVSAPMPEITPAPAVSMDKTSVAKATTNAADPAFDLDRPATPPRREVTDWDAT
ncbi:Sec-independent protein translocase protein TatB [Williamsia maris]|uniref:Sec-independent protein translocase protein TatB n=1 Tax=Williamsia maris TaxID=72806 RepID=A0ABT1H7M0_9NOCA|nr:Sec-independent protein translocase protein TatB [Williamsia maris]MCP2174254.1 sec-independent protein translocase protein TatB [Williamsia maris]